MTLTNDGGIALSLSRVDVKGYVSLNHLTATGEVRAADASIGNLDLEDATLTNNGGMALTLDRADIRSDAYLDRLTATGGVRAFGTSIGGALNLTRAAISNKVGLR